MSLLFFSGLAPGLISRNTRPSFRNSAYQAPASKQRKPGLVPGFFVPVIRSFDVRIVVKCFLLGRPGWLSFKFVWCAARYDLYHDFIATQEGQAERTVVAREYRVTNSLGAMCIKC